MKTDSPNVLSLPVPLWLCAMAIAVAWLGGTISEYGATKQLPDERDPHSSPISRSANTEPEGKETDASPSGFEPVAPEGASGLAYATAMPLGLERMRAFNEAVRGISAANWQEVAEAALQARERKRISEIEETWIYQRIGEVAGPVAMKFFEPEDMNAKHFRRGGLSTLHGWAAKDPNAAWAYLESLPSSNFRDMQTTGFLRATVQRDQAKSQTALESMSPDAQSKFLFESLLSDVPGPYARLAESWLAKSSSKDPAPLSAVFGRLVDLELSKGIEYAGSQEMAGWLSNYKGKAYMVNESLNQVLRAQSMNDPARALSLVELLLPHENPLGAHQGWNLVSESVAMLLSSNPEAGLKWITERQTSPLYGPAVYALLAEQGAGMSEATIQTWIDSVPDPTIQKRIMEARERLKAAPAGTDQSLSAKVRKSLSGQR